MSNIISIERVGIKGSINYRNGILKFHLQISFFFLPTLMEQNFNANASVSGVSTRALAHYAREKEKNHDGIPFPLSATQ